MERVIVLWLSPEFSRGQLKIPKTPFLGLSLLLNPTETLATQANEERRSRRADVKGEGERNFRVFFFLSLPISSTYRTLSSSVIYINTETVIQ